MRAGSERASSLRLEIQVRQTDDNGKSSPARDALYGPYIYSSFSGGDLTIAALVPEFHKGAQNKEPVFLELPCVQTISVSSARSIGTVRSLGTVQPKGFTRGGRVIAGTIVFVENGYNLFSEMGRMAANDPARKEFSSYYPDEIPVIDILISGCNEYGKEVHAAIVGLEITNTGMTHSVDDLYTEGTMSYVAVAHFPLLMDSNKVWEARRTLMSNPRSTALGTSLRAEYEAAKRLDRSTEQAVPHSMSEQELALVQQLYTGKAGEDKVPAGLSYSDRLALQRLLFELGRNR